ncbi:MAG: hypothetical protein ABIE47_06905 [Pseudomonadota bacterium]
MNNSDSVYKRLLSSFMLPAIDSDDCRLFTEEDRDGIRWIFSHTPEGKTRIAPSKEKIEAFIAHLDHYCEGKKSLLDQPQKIDIREKREDVLKNSTHLLKVLKKIERGQIILWHDETMDHFGAGSAGKDSGGDFLCQIIQDAWDTVGPLQKFIKTLKSYHEQTETKQVGRKKADSDNFIQHLAAIYIEHIGKKPTTYKNGPFYSVVQLVLEKFKLPSDDPSRAIKAALTKI